MGAEKYDELTRLVGEARAQYEEFHGGKKVAAMRARKLLQQIKKLAQECRIEIQELKKPKGEAPPPAP
ncbi:MAG TPA: histone H1 [Planctomycetota bacterium]|jgi:histone H1-like protein Hc1|nr:histone H1 [Planctomycetota bacterium]